MHPEAHDRFLGPQVTDVIHNWASRKTILLSVYVKIRFFTFPRFMLSSFLSC